MDFSMISAAVGAITATKELAKAAVGVRDFNEIAPVIAKMNDQLLQAQDALFAHQSQLLVLQKQYLEATKELGKVKETLAQRGRYSLVELAIGNFAYRVNITPEASHVDDPILAEPVHHVCQLCFDKGVKTVLQRQVRFGSVELHCHSCDRAVDTGEREPFAL